MKNILTRNKYIHFILIAIFISSSLSLHSQIRKVVNVNSVITPPYPIYLNDYCATGSNKLRISLVFQDPDEPTWDVYLKIRLESSKIKIETKPDFKLQNPITLHTGIPRWLSGNELYEYFDYNNVTISGISRKELEQSGGRLPEGFYQLSIEVFSHMSGGSMSNVNISAFNISLYDAPTVVLPISETIVKPSDLQNILFQWQLPVAENPLSVRYKLHLYEVYDPNQDPVNAIANNTAQEIFISEELSFTSYQYDMTKPLLEPGRMYIYLVEAYDISGRAIFKNDGVSEVKWFYYGYPTGGNIKLELPDNNYGYSLRDYKIFRWTAPDNIVAGQAYSYQLKMVELEENQLPEEGIVSNTEYYHYRSNNSIGNLDHEVVYSQRFNSMKAYAWQVKAFSDDTKIAESEVRKFYGPPVMEAFKAGNHIVEVERVSSTDLHNLTGTGNVRISPIEKIEVRFENINLELIGGEWTLQEGEVKADMSGADPIPLNPEYEQNDIAYFHPEKLAITQNDGLRLFGVVWWEFPLESDAREKAYVKSVPDWFIYDEYRLIGISQVDEKTREFNLINPMGFTIVLNDKSNFLLRGENDYVLRFEGDILLPESVKSGKKARIPVGFKVQQLFYIPGTKPYISIFPVSNVQMELIPDSYVFDFSEVISPGRFQSDPEWKGFYVNTFTTAYHVNFEASRQLKMTEKILWDADLEQDDSLKFWVSTTGLDFKQKFESDNITNSSFNTFPAELHLLEVDVYKGKVTSGQAKGSIVIPLISETEKHYFTVSLTNKGFKEGFLDKSLDDREIVFNPDGGEQIINLKIKRALFADNERFDMVIDFDWPALDIKFEDLNHFKAWGDYDIGFGKPKGVMPLTRQVSGSIRGFPITVNYIGCGSSQGIYSFGVNATVDLGDDVAGAEGPPQSNIYSIARNEVLGEFVPRPPAVDEDVSSTAGSTSATQMPDQITGTGYDSPENISDGFNYEEYEAEIEAWMDDKRNEVVDNVSRYYEDLDVSGDNTIDPDSWIYNDSDLAGEDTEDGFNFDFDVEMDFSPENLRTILYDFIEMMPDEYYDEAVAVKEGILSLEERYQVDIFAALTDADSIFNLILKREYDKIINDLLKPVQDITDTANKYITETINSVRDMANEGVTDVTGMVIDGVADEVKECTDDDEIKELITEAADGIKQIVINEITGRINGFVQDRITTPITEGVIGTISRIVQDSVRSQLTTAGYRIIDENFDANLDDVINIDRIFQSLDEEVFVRLFNSDSVVAAIDAAKVAFLDEYLNPTEIFDTLFDQIIQAGLEYATEEIVNEIIDDVVEEYGEEAGEVITTIFDNVGENIELDFSDLPDKIAEGRFDEIIKFDPSTIKITTDVVDVTGQIKLESDSVYGEVFKGKLDVLVKIPKPFKMEARYINGKVNDMNYWFAGIGFEGMKGEGDSDADKLPTMVPIGPVGLAKASGKVYHHMSITEDTEVPDPNIDYGAHLQLTIYDMMTGGEQLALFIEGNYISESSGDYTLYFHGEVDIGNNGAKPIAEGEVTITYNSAEEHFMGHGEVVIDNPGVLCAEGTIDVDVKPKVWMVAVGSEDDRIEFVPACFGWSPTGWLVVTQKDLDLGLGVSFSGYAKSPSVKIFGTRYYGYAEFGLAAGIQVIVIYRPSVKLKEAALWAEAWAEFGIEKRKKHKTSKWVVAEAWLKGEASVIFEPPPVKAKGYLKGKCRIVCFTVRFEMDYSVTL